MNKVQALEILKQIAAAYTQFDIDEKRIQVWCSHLEKMPFDLVMINLNRHIAEKRFPPTIAEISAKEPEKNEFLEKVKQWEKESRYASQSAKS
jgi:hypothetical protein